MGKIYIDDNVIKSKEWGKGEFNKWQALIDLYLLADKSKGNAVVKISERKFSDRWGWSRRKVQLFIKELENNETIKEPKGANKGTNGGTILILENTGLIGVDGSNKGANGGTIKSENKQVQKNEFSYPSLEEIKFYCAERNNSIDAEQFFDYYSARGWTMGKSQETIKDWKAIVRIWERNNNDGDSKEPSQKEEKSDNENIFEIDEPRGVQV